MTLERKNAKENKSDEKDGIYGRTNYMKYRNAQIHLEEQFRIDNPNTLEAIVLSYSYEGMMDLPLSKTTDSAMKRWLEDYIAFIKEFWGDWFGRIEGWEKDLDLSKWDELSRREKVHYFEEARHFTHMGGYVITRLYDFYKEEDPEDETSELEEDTEEVKAFLNRLSYLL
jgi:hypothetical protein